MSDTKSLIMELIIPDFSKVRKAFPELKVFAFGSIPDGYFGDRQNVLFALKGSRCVIMTPIGYFNSALPDVVDEDEAFWLLQRHPAHKNVNHLMRAD